eukprot:5298165-Pyramimonas_sp.AAC.1
MSYRANICMHAQLSNALAAKEPMTVREPLVEAQLPAAAVQSVATTARGPPASGRRRPRAVGSWRSSRARQRRQHSSAAPGPSRR